MATDIATLTGTSDASIEKSTGKTWKEWMDLLDKKGALECTHKEIAALLSEHVDSSWWCQTIAVGYEKYKGKRVLGQTSDGKFQIGVSKTIDLDKNIVWDIISSGKGTEIWLGKGLGEEEVSPGAYHTSEGISGKITVLKHCSHFRMTWQPRNWKHASVLQIRVEPKGEKTVLSFHQEGLPSSQEREKMKTYWTEKIDQLCRELLKKEE